MPQYFASARADCAAVQTFFELRQLLQNLVQMVRLNAGFC